MEGLDSLEAKKGNGVVPPPPELKAATLIVCPLAVLKQWASEIEEKVHPAVRLSVHTYYSKVLSKGCLVGPKETTLKKWSCQMEILLAPFNNAWD